MDFKWKSAYTFPIDANVAGNELLRIRGEHQRLTSEIIINESRDKNAILHQCFEWQDDKAAELWRKQQARHLVKNLVVVHVEGAEKEHQEVRAFVHIEKEYKPLDVVLKVPAYTSEMLADALKDFEIFKQKYLALKELTSFFAYADEIFIDFQKKV